MGRGMLELGPCDRGGMLELRRSPKQAASGPFFSKRRQKMASSKAIFEGAEVLHSLPFPHYETRLFTFSYVWYGIRIRRLVASVWPLQGQSNQGLRVTY